LKDIIKGAILSWFMNHPHEYFDDLFHDGAACIIDGKFDLDDLAQKVAADLEARLISDAKETECRQETK
jgi:hypothetical protein